MCQFKALNNRHFKVDIGLHYGSTFSPFIFNMLVKEVPSSVFTSLIYVPAKKTPVRASPRYDPASVYAPSVARRSKENDRCVLLTHNTYV